jgi:polyisoprenoid-binding protein YceI
MKHLAKLNTMTMLKSFLVFTLFIAIGTSAQNYKPVDAGSKVHFVIKNFGIATGGDLSGTEGKIYFSPDSLSECSFDVTVASSTVNTNNGMRDKSLVSDEYFDATKYPLLRLVSTKIGKTNKTDSGFYYFTGNLTIKGVTREISFPFEAKKINDDYVFTGNFEIDRTQFGVGEKSMVLSNYVAVSLKVIAKKN